MKEKLKLEVGQYWHHLEAAEWKVLKDVGEGVFTCECTKGSGIWDLGHISTWNLAEFNALGYVLGRHPDNLEREWSTLAECEPGVGDVLECKYDTEGNPKISDVKIDSIKSDIAYFEDGTHAIIDNRYNSFRVKSRAVQPEQWQPKEGELVWVKDHHDNWEGKGRIIQMPCGDMLAVVYYSHTWMVLNLVGNELDLMPYSNQDEKWQTLTSLDLKVGDTITRKEGGLGKIVAITSIHIIDWGGGFQLVVNDPLRKQYKKIKNG